MTTLPLLLPPPTLPPRCRWRTAGPYPGRVGCTSPKLRVGPNGFDPRLCFTCYCVDHNEIVDVPVRPPPLPAPAGPGTELKALLAAAGLEPGGCACTARAAEMDGWGPVGCRARRAEIVGWLTEEWRKLGWLARLGTAVRAVLRGLPLDPRDPVGALVDEAIHRADEKTP